MGATLTGYGGVGEIGGNAFLLQDGRTRLWLDLGKRFGSDKDVETRGRRPGWNDFFDEFLTPRTFRYVPDLLALGVLPPHPTLYRADLGGAAGPTAADGVVVSHAHMDHVGLVGLLRPDIPILASAESRAILGSIQETGAALPENQFVAASTKGKVGRNKDGTLSGRARFGDGPHRSYRTEARTDVGDWRIEHHAIDHSIHGARATILEGPDIHLAYTGDFRLHGRHAQLSKSFLQKAGGMDALVIEGTNVHGTDGDHAHGKSTDQEVKVESDIDEAIAQAEAKGLPGFVGVSYPPRDLDRFESIYQVARRRGRRFVISVKQAHLLDALRHAGRSDLPDPRSDPVLRIHFEAQSKGTILAEADRTVAVADAGLGVHQERVDDATFDRLVEQDYDSWAHPYLWSGNRVSSRDIAAQPEAYLFSISYWSITELLDIFPDPAKAGGLYIHSQTQPFNDDMIVNERKLQRWLKAFDLEFAKTHVSGHLGEENLAWVLDELRPRVLVPIHSLAPDVTADRYEAKTGLRAALPVYGKALEIGRPSMS